MNRKLLYLLCLFLLAFTELKAEEKDSLQHFSANKKVIYSFIIQDSPTRLFSMRQFDEDFLSGYRLYSRQMGNYFSPGMNYLIQAVTSFAIFIPLTHEEGHRSILVSRNIGSISQPFFMSRRGGYIEGVTDNSLKKLRDTDFPNFARLYTSGLESDYMLTHREETLFAFEKAKFPSLMVEYLMRKAMMLQYYLIGFIKYDVDKTEEANELDRDIVGNDVYGIARHLYRPNMTFQRYTRYADLTPEEVSYVRKLGYRSLLNLLNLNMIGISNVRISNSLSISIGMGHAMGPFGDFTDENLWLVCGKKWLIEAYVRHYENRDHTFLAGGAGIKNYPLTERFITSLNVHLWNQPLNLGFNDSESKFGGSVEWVGRYFFLTHRGLQQKGISIDLGLIYKSAGFLPEEVIMRKHLGVRIGTSFALDK